MVLEPIRRKLAPSRYTPRKLFKAVRNPELFKYEGNRLGVKLNREYHRRWPHSGFDVMGADWDTLVILDGCRYDLFEDEYDSLLSEDDDFELRSVTSRGSASKEFLQRNFREGTHYDTVYVTTNPFVSAEDSERFHAVENLFLTEWDPELNTVPPEPVTEAAQRISDSYPHKRLIVHYMQPHYPFIGERGRSLEHRGLYPDDAVELGRRPETDDVSGAPKRIWGRLKLGETDAETVWEMYRENLRYVAPHARELIEAVDGKSVVTSDHGNLFGERLWPIPVRGYGHPEFIHVPELLEVPWLEIEADDRREIRADRPDKQESERLDIDDETVENRLKHLGYHE